MFIESLYIVGPAGCFFENVCPASTKPQLFVEMSVSRRRNPYFFDDVKFDWWARAFGGVGLSSTAPAYKIRHAISEAERNPTKSAECPETVSSAAAPTFPYSRAGGQDYLSYTLTPQTVRSHRFWGPAARSYRFWRPLGTIWDLWGPSGDHLGHGFDEVIDFITESDLPEFADRSV